MKKFIIKIESEIRENKYVGEFTIENIPSQSKLFRSLVEYISENKIIQNKAEKGSPKICELLNVKLDVPFNVVGQNYSNPYVFRQKGSFITLISKTGEEAHNWLICNLLEGTMQIEEIK